MVENCVDAAKALEMCVLMISHRLLPLVQSIASHGTFTLVAEEGGLGSVGFVVTYFFVLPPQ